MCSLKSARIGNRVKMLKYIKGYRHILKSKWSLYLQYRNAGRCFLSLGFFFMLLSGSLIMSWRSTVHFCQLRGPVFEMSVARLVIEFSRLVHVMILSIL